MSPLLCLCSNCDKLVLDASMGKSFYIFFALLCFDSWFRSFATAEGDVRQLDDGEWNDEGGCLDRRFL